MEKVEKIFGSGNAKTRCIAVATYPFFNQARRKSIRRPVEPHKSMGDMMPVMQEKKEVPKPEVEVMEKTDTLEEEDTPWRLILYNDEEHTFEEVINQLIKALGCSVSKAEELTWKVHSDGKAVVFEGTFEECLKINSVLQEIELITEIKG
ncbi:MAG: ATP-dependent Clp protease adaptor ClpS [Balneolaceae bacterium]